MPTQNIFNLVDTWASGGGPYTSIKMNATDNDVGSASLLMDLQVGGTSRFSVEKSGTIQLPSGVINRQGGDIQFQRSGQILLYAGLSYTRLKGIEIALNPNGSGDVFLNRRAAANLQLGAVDTTGTTAPTPQTLSVQSWTSSTNNNQPGANFTIAGSQGTGTGAGGSIIFQVAPAGAVSNGVQNALATALTIAPSSSGNAGLPSVSIGGATNVWLQAIDANTLGIAGMAALRGGGTEGIWLKTGLGIGSAVNSPDVYLYRDAANTLALRNGTNAQTFRAYNTWTSFGSGTEIWERGKFAWESNVLTIGTEKGANGGTARALEFQTDGTTRLTITTAGGANFAGGVIVAANMVMTGSASNLEFVASGTFAPSAVVGRAFVDGTNNGVFSLNSTGHLGFTGGNATLTGNDVRLYRDNADTLALRRGTNAQMFRVYSTFTDASNYERGALNAGADFIELAAETAGTGDDNLDVRLTPAGTGSVRFGTHTGTTDTAISGYIEIKDAGGTIRKLAVIS